MNQPIVYVFALLKRKIVNALNVHSSDFKLWIITTLAYNSPITNFKNISKCYYPSIFMFLFHSSIPKVLPLININGVHQKCATTLHFPSRNDLDAVIAICSYPKKYTRLNWVGCDERRYHSRPRENSTQSATRYHCSPYLACSGSRLGYIELAEMSWSGISPLSIPSAAWHCSETIVHTCLEGSQSRSSRSTCAWNCTTWIIIFSIKLPLRLICIASISDWD